MNHIPGTTLARGHCPNSISDAATKIATCHISVIPYIVAEGLPFDKLGCSNVMARDMS
jgi:hypothetical protein